MIQSLYRIGKVLQHEHPEYYTPWKNPFPGREETARVVIIHVEKQKIVDVSFEPYKANHEDKYLYRKVAGANGTNVVPTLILQVDDKPKVQHDNIRKTLKKVVASLKNYGYDFLPISAIDGQLAEKIWALELNKKESHILTFKIDGQWLGDFEKNKELFIAEAYNKYKNKSSASHELCAVTNTVGEVWGRVDTLGFTVNDKTFNRNGFNDKLSYKMFPVSPAAVKVLEGTKNLILERLTQNFYGLKFFILPHFINVSDEGIADGMTTFLDKKVNPLTNSTEGKYSIISSENILHEIIEDEALSGGNIYYDIFFYQPNNAQFLIKLHLSDVLPSQLRRIFDVKKAVETKYQSFTKIVTKKEVFNFYISFKKIKNYFSQKVKTDTVFHPTFFKVLEAVFYGQALNEQLLVRAFNQEVRKAFKQRHENQYRWSQLAVEAFVFWQFFLQLNLLKDKNMDTSKPAASLATTAFQFVEQHSTFFADNYLKGLFFLGCATEKLLEKQRKKLDSEPFFNQLNGLVVSDRNARKIFNKLNAKIGDYKNISSGDGKIYPNELRYLEDLLAFTSETLIGSSNVSLDDQSFAFITGLTMQKKFSAIQRTENIAKKAAAEAA